MTELGDSDVLLRALDSLADELAGTSRQRMLSTLRGFCGYLVRRGLLTADPTSAEELKVRTDSSEDVRAFTSDEVHELIVAASQPAPPRVRSAWPARDIAVIDVLAHCGLRVSELCALTASSIDRAGEQPLIRVRRGAKGGRHRTVPLPSPTLTRIDHYLSERAAATTAKSTLFVRADHGALNQQFVDNMLRRVALVAGVEAPDGAMAHALRHSYGMTLAVRGVPQPVIQQLLGHVDPRTTSIYTKAHAGDLTHTLREAGLL